MSTEVETPEKVYCCTTDSNSALNPMLSALLTNQSKQTDPTTMAMMMNGGYGNQMWNNPMMMLVWLYAMRWMNGWGGVDGAAAATNTEALNYNNRQISELRSTVDNNHNNDLVIQAIQGNGAAIHELSTTLNSDYNTISQAICSIKSAIEGVAGQIGYSAEKVINAVNMGDSNIISAIQSTACATQRTILDSTNQLNSAITNQGYQNQLANERQTNILQSQLAANHSADQLQACQNNGAVLGRIDQLSNGISAGFSQVGYAAQQNTQAIINSQNAGVQRILDQMCANNTQSLRDKLAEYSQAAQTEAIVNRLSNTGCACNA